MSKEEIIIQPELIKTVEYFDCQDSLLGSPLNSEKFDTREEELLHEIGVEVVYFDSLEELKEEIVEFLMYTVRFDLHVKALFSTVNERVAIILR